MWTKRNCMMLAVMLLWSLPSYSQGNPPEIIADFRMNGARTDQAHEDNAGRLREKVTVKDTIAVNTVPEPVPAPGVAGRGGKLHVKTNALGWGLAIANVAVETDLGRHWSFNLPAYYSAWNYFSSTVKFRTAMIQPEIRYWFKKDNDGWYAGGHAGIGHYNVATDGEYRTQDHEGKSPAWGGGFALGYRLPVSGNGRWKMEFSVGAGAYRLHHDKFRNHTDGMLAYTEKKTYIGIDQATVSFSYAFDLKRKGGAR